MSREPWKGNPWSETIVKELLAWGEDPVSRVGFGVVIANKIKDPEATVSRRRVGRNGGGSRLKKHINAVFGLLERQGILRRELMYVTITDRGALRRVLAEKDLFGFMEDGS